MELQIKENHIEDNISMLGEDIEREIKSFVGIHNKDDLMDDELIAIQLDFMENFTLKQLKIIAGYYEKKLSKKMTKKDYALFIAYFETNIANFEIVSQRKHLWSCIEDISNDNYFRKYLDNIIP
jgi:hypothetical protein